MAADYLSASATLHVSGILSSGDLPRGLPCCLERAVVSLPFLCSDTDQAKYCASRPVLLTAKGHDKLPICGPSQLKEVEHAPEGGMIVRSYCDHSNIPGCRSRKSGIR